MCQRTSRTIGYIERWRQEKKKYESVIRPGNRTWTREERDKTYRFLGRDEEL